MQVTHKDVLNAGGTFQKLFAYPLEIGTEAGNAAYAMAKRTRVITAELEDIDKARQATIRKYCLRDDDGQMVMVKDEAGKQTNQVKMKDQDAFDTEWLAFLVSDIELDLWPIPFPLIVSMKEIAETRDEKAKAVTNRPYLTPFEIGLLLPFMSELPDDPKPKKEDK